MPLPDNEEWGGQETCIDDCQIASRKIMGARPTRNFQLSSELWSRDDGQVTLDFTALWLGKNFALSLLSSQRVIHVPYKPWKISLSKYFKSRFNNTVLENGQKSLLQIIHVLHGKFQLESIPIDLRHSKQCFWMIGQLVCVLSYKLKNWSPFRLISYIQINVLSFSVSYKNTVCPLLSRAIKSHKLLNFFFTIFKSCT